MYEVLSHSQEEGKEETEGEHNVAEMSQDTAPGKWEGATGSGACKKLKRKQRPRQ